MEYCIYKTDDEYKAMMVVDILKKNKILTYCKNLKLQNLYGESKLWTGSDLIVGEIKIFIKNEDIEKSKRVIDCVPFLKQEYGTIENDKNKMVTYTIQRAFCFSLLSSFIIPFFFNIEYIIYFIKNNVKAKYIILISNTICFLLSLTICIFSFDFIKIIWKWNLLFIPAFCIGKYIDFYRRESNLKYLMIIPIILLIISYNIADLIFNIRLFEEY